MANDQHEVVITPSTAEYEQLAADLQILREAGTESNTAAIVAAVSATADDPLGIELSALRREITQGNASVAHKLELLDRYELAVLRTRPEPLGETVGERLRTQRHRFRRESDLRWVAFARELLAEVS